MMLVQCNSDVPISLACSIQSASVLSTASPEPRAVGTSKARDQAGSSLENVSSAGMTHGNVKAEVGVILPHPVQDHGEAAGQRNHRALSATTARKFCCPGSQLARPSTMHHDGCRLTQGTAQVDVSRLGDPARDVALARLVARRRQADLRSDLLRGGEPGGVIDRRSIR